VTKSQYYTKRAAECLLASTEIPSDRDVLLHMASVYIGIAIDIESREDPPRGLAGGAWKRNAVEPRAHH
jgi:hypothetical protein